MSAGIELGDAAGSPALMDLTELLATRLLVQGNSGSGKSHLLRRLLEQSAGLVQQVVIDPEGEFVTLGDAFGHVVVDAEASEAELQRIAARVRQHRVSVVLSLENLDAEDQMRAAASFLGGLFDAEREFWYPALVVVDEAQLFAPAAAGDVSDEARRLSLGAMTNLMCRGRKRGLAGVIATQRLAKLAKNVAAEASNFLMGRTFLDIDMARAADLLGMERRAAEAFRDLERGHFIALGPALSRRPVPVRIGEVETGGRGAAPSLLPLPDKAPGEARDLIFRAGADEAGTEGGFDLSDYASMRRAERGQRRAESVPTVDILAQLARARPAEEAGPAGEEPSEAQREAAFGEVLREVTADPEAAFKPVSLLYQDFLVRCRIRRIAGRPLDLPAFRGRLAVARAGVGGEQASGADWERAVAVASALPEELQGVFLLLARAALEGAPCPPDEAVARACGSRSPGRARKLLAYMEARGFLVLRTERRGRIAALPELGWETAPGQPNVMEPTLPAAPSLIEEGA